MEEKPLLDLSRVAEVILGPIVRVVGQLREKAPDIDPDQVMLVGAWCRDTLHAALGHDFETAATRDVDLALALSGWETFELLSNAFPRAGDTGLAFGIAGLTVDLLPFGDIEAPRGIVVPPTRVDEVSVWGFAEIFRSSMPLALNPSLAIRCPTVAGYTAAKLAAWLDRSQWGETKDANDLALAVHWYAESRQVEGRLYDVPEGQQLLVAEEADVPCAAARLLGRDVSNLLGRELQSELVGRWPGDLTMLTRNLTAGGEPRWLSQQARRLEIVGALTRGLSDQQTSKTSTRE